MNLLRTQIGLEDLILEFAQAPIELRIEHLQDWMTRLTLAPSWLARQTTFAASTYHRQCLCRTPQFDLLLLCWRPGQSSSIHDHRDSLNVTRVWQGQLTSREFGSVSPFSSPATTASVKPALIQENHLRTADLAAVDRYRIHQLANTSDQNLVTLHLYARPLRQLTVYCPQSGQISRQPVFVTEPS